MLEQRIKGIFWSLGLFLMVLNAGLFLLLVAIEGQVAFISLNVTPRTFIYLLAIPFAYYFSRDALRKAYRQSQVPSLWISLTASLRLTFLHAAGLFGIYFLFKDVSVSRFFLLVYLGCSFLLNWILLYIGPGLFSRMLYTERERLRTILYGHGPLPPNLRDYLGKADSMAMDLIGYYADSPLDLPGVEWLGTSKQVLTCEGGRKRVRADLVITYTDDASAPGFRDNVNLCLGRGARVQIYSSISKLFLDPVRIVTDGQMQFITFFEEPLQNPFNVFLKRAAVIAVSLPLVLFILPSLTLLVWIMQRIQSPGPLFFKQTRYGMNRRPFTILKYRTMHVHDRKEEGKQATKGDPRIFPFGRFLRRSSLDEFPQFFNALRGEMSVVGPRPHLTKHDRQFEKLYSRYRSRHYVKPGITGLAQVSGYRGEATSEQAIIGRVQHDLQYITQWSVSTEIYIFLKTIWQVLFPPKSAY